MKYSKYILIGIVFIFLISLFLFLRGYEIIMSTSYGDLDGDGVDERVILTKNLLSDHGRYVIIYKHNSLDYIEIYREDFTELRPWKLVCGDIDGDGIDEISVGVYKEAIFHPVMAKRPFIYSFESPRLVPKWRGSRLSRPFTDYTFFDLDKDGIDDLIAIEELQDGKNIIQTYKWKYFGFEGSFESQAFDRLLSLESSKDLTTVDEDGNEYRVELIESRLILERID